MGRKRRKSLVKTSTVLKESAQDFCENTSLHGFSYWISSGNEMTQKNHINMNMMTKIV